MNPDISHRHRGGRAQPEQRRPCATEFESIALVLQGGGALGAYQAGVYQRLLEADIEPTWVSGISIGAINSAIIAGNPREQRIARLREFWDLVSAGGDAGMGASWLGLPLADPLRAWVNQLAAARVVAHGVAGFFEPCWPWSCAGWPDGVSSFYDTAPLRATIERLVDFERINAGDTRLSIGAVNVGTGNFVYFDNATDTIRPEHVMASCALPPAFAAVDIDGEKYWDGGVVSNTPLDWVLSSRSGLHTLVFQVDLWSARGALPGNLADVATRMKDIMYSSRTRAATDAFRCAEQLRTAFKELHARLPPELAATEQARLLAQESDAALFNIVQLVYRAASYEGQHKDFTFSRRAMQEHWQAGYANAASTLSHEEILRLPAAAANPMVFDFLTGPAGPVPPSLQEHSV